MKKLTAAVMVCILFLFVEQTKAGNFQVKTTKEPEWVSKKTYSYTNTNLDQQAVDGIIDLVFEDQIDLQSQSVYKKRVYKLLSEAGVQNNSQITFYFDPTYQELDIHTIKIIRGNQVINQLDLSKINTVHQEKELEKFIYNGSLTAVMIMEDVRKGDVIEYSYTLKGFNPIFKNVYANVFDLQYGVPLYNLYYKLIVPTGRSITLKNLHTDIQTSISKDASGTVYQWNTSNISALTLQDNVPSWYNPYPSVFISEYKSWKEVNDVAKVMFPYQIPLSPELKNKIAFIEKYNSTPEKKVSAALRFVQDDIRYMGIEMGVNSHKPHSPDQVFHQRFGDCKDKAYLLCTILRKMNIEAFPVLINTDNKNTLFDLLPSLIAFDHTTVKVRLNNKDYYFDPTISYQRGPIDNIYYPDYKAGLVLTDTTTNLTTIPPHLNSREDVKETFNVPNMNGTSELIVTTKYTGSFADDIRSYFKTSSYDQIKNDYVKYYSTYFSKIKADTISLTDNDETGELITKEYYHINEFWGSSSTKLKVNFAPYVINSLIKKPKETERTMPYSISYPENYSELIEVNLPESWSIKNVTDSTKCAQFALNSDIKCTGNQVTLKYNFNTCKDFVSANETPDYLKAINKADDICNGYELSYTISGGTTSSASTIDDTPSFPTLYVALGICVLITYMVRRNRRSNSSY